MKKIFLTSALAIFAVTSVSAQTSEYYVVRDATTKKCTVVDPEIEHNRTSS